MKICALTTVSGPYISARYTAFTTTFQEHALTLIELGEVSSIYKWRNTNSNVPYNRILLSKQSAESQSFFKLTKLLFKELKRINPDVLVICGYGVPGMLQALVWGAWHRKPSVLLSDSKEDDAERVRWREFLKSLIVKQYGAALVAGQPHKRYLEQLGKRPEAIFFGYDVINNEDLHPDKSRALPPPLKKPYFLVVSRFVPKKNLILLLSAYKAYRDKAGNRAWELVICGDGPLSDDIHRVISDYDMRNSVHLPGFLQYEELLPYFAHAGSFVHASVQEQWGLVVNEAMAAGLPVLVSRRCGCFEDLIIEGVTGFGFNPENADELARLMLQVSSGEIDLKAVSDAALNHIENFSLGSFVHGLNQAIEYAAGGRDR